jgi:pimeloyl-ACP methyl ester carboxylesterase
MLDRRDMMLGGGALIAGMGLSAPAWGAAFASRRIAVSVRGAGRDVLLIPGLASGPGIWNNVVAGVPGYRWHLVHVKGFAGLPPEANASGPLVQPLADEIGRYVREAKLRRPAVVGHSMGGTLALMTGLSGAAGRVMMVDMLPAGAGMVGGTARGMGYLADQMSQYFTGTKAGRAYLAQIVAQAPGAKGSDPDVIANALRDLAAIDLEGRLASLGIPLEVIYAIGSDAAQAKAISQRFRTAFAGKKDARLLAIGPSGHVVMNDQPARFASALSAFLK